MEAGGAAMNAQKRLEDLETEIGGIKAEIEALTTQHAKEVAAGDDGSVDTLHGRIVDARHRLEAAQMRRAPLERALEAELDAARAKVAKELTADADARLDALEATLAQALEAARALALITNRLDQNAALHWAVAAHSAVDAGGSPARRHLAGLDELHTLTDGAFRKLRHVAQDYAARSVSIPVPTKSRRAA